LDDDHGIGILERCSSGGVVRSSFRSCDPGPEGSSGPWPARAGVHVQVTRLNSGLHPFSYSCTHTPPAPAGAGGPGHAFFMYTSIISCMSSCPAELHLQLHRRRHTALCRAGRLPSARRVSAPSLDMRLAHPRHARSLLKAHTALQTEPPARCGMVHGLAYDPATARARQHITQHRSEQRCQCVDTRGARAHAGRAQSRLGRGLKARPGTSPA
jgi:hypothetical protein